MQPNNPWQPNNNPYQQPPQPQAPVQGPAGQYQSVPPPQIGANNGRTGHNPYEFIVAPNTPKGPSRLTGNKSLLVRLSLIIGGAVLLMILIAIGVSLLGPKDSTASLTAIAQRQQEIVRIAADASKNASSQGTQNFATTVTISVSSDQQQVLGQLKKTGTKLNNKTLNLNKDPKTDTLLESAKASGTYDSAVMQNLNGQLKTYTQLLQTTYRSTSSKSAKQLLQSSYTSADSLYKQSQALLATN